PRKHRFALPRARIQASDVLVDCYLAGSQTTRVELIAATARCVQSLRAYAHTMAALSVRRKEVSLIFRGLVGLVIENFRFDDRDTDKTLSLLSHSARKLQACDDNLFQQTITLAQPEFGEYLSKYLERPRRSRSIALAGFREEGEGETFSY